MQEQTLNKEFRIYYNMLSESQKQTLLALVKSFLDTSDKDTNRVSVAQYNKEIEEAENRVANGHFTSHESLLKEAEKW